MPEFRPCFATLAACIAILLTTATFGQASEQADLLEEIIVTSQLRTTTLGDISSSITVLDEEFINAVTVQHFEELSQFVPNLNWSGEGSRARYFQIRGIGELEQYEGAPNASVGFIVDDIDFSAIGGIATLFDIRQVEVLRGPQGTRYGANALAGLIYMRSNDPDNNFDASGEVTIGNDDTLAIGGAVGGPVARSNGKLSYRIAVQQYQSNGFRDNAFLNRNDTYGRDELSTRAKLRWVPNDHWQVDLTGLYVDLDNGYDAWSIDNGLTVYSDKPGKDAQESTAGALRVTSSTADAFTFISITGAASSDILFSFDADWGNDTFWAPVVYDFTQESRRKRDTFNQELRLVSTPEGALFGGRVDWLTGIYALTLRESINRVDQGIYADGVFCTPCLLDTTVDSDYEATSIAFFGELDIPLGAATNLTLGLRWERRSAEYTDTDGNLFDPTDNMVGGELALNHEWSDQTRLYARIARGYKAGGFNLGFAGTDFSTAGLNVTAGQIEFDPEFLWNYELGIRASSVNKEITVDFNLFWQEREDAQIRIPIQLVANDPTTFIFFTDNAAAARNIGLEATLLWQFSDRIELSSSIGLLDTEIAIFTAQPGLEGRDLPHAPGYTFALSGQYQHPQGWFVRADLTGKDRFFYDVSHDERSKAYALTDLRAGREWQHWSVDVWVRNVFDQRYTVRGFFFGNEPPDFPPTRYTRLGDPRHFGVTITYKIQ